MAKKFPLHYQIILALILGALFGAFFNINQHKLLITHSTDGKQITQEIENWQTIKLISPDTLTEFAYDDQIQIIRHFRKNKNFDSAEILSESGEKSTLTKISKIRKEKTIATYISPIGDLFIRLLSFLAIPLVIATLIVGAASLGDIKKLGRIGGKTLALYVGTTIIAITIGVTAANVIKPGKQVNEDARNRLLGAYQEESSEKILNKVDIDAEYVLNYFVDIVPRNPMGAIANGNMLQIVFFAVIFGVTLTLIDKRKSGIVVDFFSGVSDVMIAMVNFIMKLAPYGVFALMAATVADFGFSILQTLVWYIFAVVLGLVLQIGIVYVLLVYFVGRQNPLTFMKAIRNAQAIGFSTSSSAATLPVTLDCVENNLGVNKQIAGFVLPLGATINMDGTALYQGVAAIFIAQVYGFDLNIAEQLTIILTAVLASIGTAPVPGVGIIMLVMILQSVNVPPEGIALILGVDRILDMARTVCNVTGDAAVTVAVAGSENQISPVNST